LTEIKAIFPPILDILPIKEGAGTMENTDRIYFAQRAAEEQERAATAEDPEAAEAHRRLQRAYLERASIGERPVQHAEPLA
jgi:hypothetical protein